MDELPASLLFDMSPLSPWSMVFSALRYLGIVLSGSCLPYCFSLYISCIHTCIHTCIQAYCVCMCAPSPIPWPTDPMPAGPRTVGRPYTRHLGRDTYLGTRDTCLCIRDTCLCTHARTQIHTLRVCICVCACVPRAASERACMHACIRA